MQSAQFFNVASLFLLSVLYVVASAPTPVVYMVFLKLFKYQYNHRNVTSAS